MGKMVGTISCSGAATRPREKFQMIAERDSLTGLESGWRRIWGEAVPVRRAVRVSQASNHALRRLHRRMTKVAVHSCKFFVLAAYFPPDRGLLVPADRAAGITLALSGQQRGWQSARQVQILSGGRGLWLKPRRVDPHVAVARDGRHALVVEESELHRRLAA